jgi:hypothetical protein
LFSAGRHCTRFAASGCPLLMVRAARCVLLLLLLLLLFLLV